MIKLIRYIYVSLRYPHRRDFVSMGLGIAARHGRCRPYWEKHLSLCKAFIERGLTASQPSSVLILGCGRLLDCPVEAFGGVSVTCVDIDPLALADAKKKAPSWSYVCCDVTGIFDEWTRNLCQWCKDISLSFDAFIEKLQTLRMVQGAIDNALTGDFDVVLSLNILGQIPVYWRDRADHYITRYRGPLTPEAQERVDDIVSKHCALLQNAHLQQLFSHALTQVLLITDTSFNYYERDKSDWDVTSALSVSLPTRGALWEEREKDSWLWHIAPQGVEQAEYGIIHEIAAVRYERIEH